MLCLAFVQLGFALSRPRVLFYRLVKLGSSCICRMRLRRGFPRRSYQYTTHNIIYSLEEDLNLISI